MVWMKLVETMGENLLKVVSTETVSLVSMVTQTGESQTTLEEKDPKTVSKKTHDLVGVEERRTYELYSFLAFSIQPVYFGTKPDTKR